MMNPLIVRVREFVRRHALARPGARVVAAVSGGSDSVALVHILHELHRAGDLILVGVAHLNHGLRDTSERDLQLAQRVAESLGLPAFVERADVNARAARERRSIEVAAHAERYEFFERARLSQSADLVAVGHTRDDQAETFLLRMLRGAGAQGLAGMYPRRGPVVRPLLGCRRRDLREYLDARHVAYVDDESNADVSIARNRVRAELLPLLEKRFNPGIVDVLADEAALARETWQAVREAADEVYAGVTSAPSGHGSERRLDVAALAGALPALRRAVVRRAMSEVAGGRPISFAHSEAALQLLDGDADGELDLPGHRMERRGEWIVLTGRPPGTVGRGKADPATVFHYSLSVPGEVRLAEAGCVVSAEPFAAETDAEPRPGLGQDLVAHVRRDLCPEGLGVRNRRPGDRFRPAGLGGRKKLQDFFVDRKVARPLRDRVPLVVDQSDRIVWVAGYGIDEAFRVTDPSQGVLILKLTQIKNGAL